MPFCQLSANKPDLVGLQVEGTLMIVTGGNRLVAGEKKQEALLTSCLWRSGPEIYH